MSERATPPVDAAHAHKFNATRITAWHTPVLRCACGTWTSRSRIKNGEPPYGNAMAKGLESRLAKAHPDAPGAPWPDLPAKRAHPASPDVTAAVDETHAARRAR